MKQLQGWKAFGARKSARYTIFSLNDHNLQLLNVLCIIIYYSFIFPFLIWKTVDKNFQKYVYMHLLIEKDFIGIPFSILNIMKFVNYGFLEELNAFSVKICFYIIILSLEIYSHD